ncbi:hypothetical protein B0G77_3169 [Paraburkholderia sp. BL10I2N1]|nr:hypothetical protein B0G77_3169 [Paraburkholderia sp. BL10I2N1]
MAACELCTDLHGRPSTTDRRQGFALLGVGELCGVPAVEHYRCVACGASFSRILIGDPNDRIWRSLDCHSTENA